MKRLGSEIPLYTDRIGPAQPWQDNWLAFSNGRAALAWLLDKCDIKSTVSVCAYTCPSVPIFLRNRGMDVSIYDVGDNPIISRCIILPALFGSLPWLKYEDYAPLTVVDVAQTAFGHVDFKIPRHGVVLSCPRKCTELADGAVLAISDSIGGWHTAIDGLPIAENAASAKIIARGMMDRPSCDRLHWNKYSERKWPTTPHRMSDPSRAMLERLDREWHRNTRQRNADSLAMYLWTPRRQMWTWKIAAPAPFCFPIFVGNPDEIIAELKPQNIFLTRLWSDAEHDPKLHPNAAWMAAHLVSLPVDQRHDVNDMERIAKAVLAVAKPPPDPPEGMRRFVA